VCQPPPSFLDITHLDIESRKLPAYYTIPLAHSPEYLVAPRNSCLGRSRPSLRCWVFQRSRPPPPTLANRSMLTYLNSPPSPNLQTVSLDAAMKALVLKPVPFDFRCAHPPLVGAHHRSRFLTTYAFRCSVEAKSKIDSVMTGFMLHSRRFSGQALISNIGRASICVH